MPTLLFFVSGLSLLTFQNVLRLLSQVAKGYAKQGWLRAVQPYIAKFVALLEMLFGKLTKFEFSFTHVCLVAILIVLLGEFGPAPQRYGKAKRD